jgi:hypothetical protein
MERKSGKNVYGDYKAVHSKSVALGSLVQKLAV